MRGLVFALLLTLVSCSQKPAPVGEGPADLLSVVEMSNAQASVQLAKGFWKLEGGSWRWTRGHFALVLRPPAKASETGARLEMKFSLPQVVLDKTGPLTLRATVNGFELEPATFAEAGEHTYDRAVPAAALEGDAVDVEFATDKFLPAGSADDRELALVALSAGLISR